MNVIILGSGNVASHIALTLKEKRIKICQIYSRNYSNAKKLAKTVNAEAISDLNKISQSADFYFIAVSDKAISEVVEKMPQVSGIVAHTAGCVPVSVLKKFPSYGSFYPYQTFTKGREIDFNKIYIFIEGNNKETEQKLSEIALLISNQVETTDFDKRATLHLAAVFGCNFTNHLYSISQKILEDAGLSFDYIKPIIEETALKACEIEPYNAQTGPAKRKDLKIINFHQKKLGDNKNFIEFYNLFSNSIMDMYNIGENIEK